MICTMVMAELLAIMLRISYIEFIFYPIINIFIIQVMSLNNAQMEWVAEHLGHSLDVEKQYYRMTSSTIEKAKIAKLLILADKGQVPKNQTLDEIDFGKVRFMLEKC